MPSNILNPEELTISIDVIVNEETEDSSDPEDESKDEEMNDEEGHGSPQVGDGSDDQDKDNKEGTELPKTATPIYNLIFIGFLLATVGVELAIVLRRRKSSLN